MIEDSSIPYSIVHATQFFEFIGASPTRPPAAPRCAWHTCSSSPSSPRTWPARSQTASSRSPGPQQFRLDELVRDTLRERPPSETVNYFDLKGLAVRSPGLVPRPVLVGLRALDARASQRQGRSPGGLARVPALGRRKRNSDRHDAAVTAALTRLNHRSWYEARAMNMTKPGLDANHTGCGLHEAGFVQGEGDTRTPDYAVHRQDCRGRSEHHTTP